MIQRIGRTTVLVHDYDEALAFYREKLGFETIFDARLDNGFRAVHVGPGGQEGVGLWLLEASGADARERVGRQTAGEPLLVLYTSDCRRACAELERRGVPIVSQPVEEDASVYAHFADLYGNELVLVELKG